jgi:[acyl-carrier-protein] S-malonyltransferase
VRLFGGSDASPVIDISAGMDKLAEQISQTVQWADCLQGCVEAGASTFLELGPGRALSEMAAIAYPNIPPRSLEDFNLAPAGPSRRRGTSRAVLDYGGSWRGQQSTSP